MIFLSAVPDSPYFIWQIEVQLCNFHSFQIPPNDIHILIGYNPSTGINSRFADFVEAAREKASFFFYPDTRIGKRYVPAIRPHVIKKHFQAFPRLEGEIVFYHDSDIVFTHTLPDFEQLSKDDIFYFSDTRNYLSSPAIKYFGPLVFAEMCTLLQISEQLVEGNDENAGGAQYLLKNVDWTFWDTVESNAERLFAHLEDNAAKYAQSFSKDNGVSIDAYRKINSWYADMWALLWLCFKTRTVRCTSELDFCWPSDPASAWTRCKIFHNAGIDRSQSDRFFYKANYTSREPWYDDFSFITRSSCCYHYVQLIYQAARHKIYSLPDVTFLITLRVDSQDRIDNVTTILNYLTKHFRTNILLIEADSSPRLQPENIPRGVKYLYVTDNQPIFHRQRYYNHLVGLCDTDIVIKYDADVILAPSQIYNAVTAIRKDNVDVCYPFDGDFLMVPRIHKEHFMRSLDIRVLSRYRSSFGRYYPSYGGCIVLRKSAYTRMGMENTNFNGWGLEDQELFRRTNILGYKVTRQEGPLFHLDHSRGTHSWYFDRNEEANSHREYLKVCNMDRDELDAYISTWERFT